MPLGFFYAAFDRRKRTRCWRVWLYPAAISLTIEVLQLVLRKGVFEWDDVFHNVLGFVLAYWFSRLLVWGPKRLDVNNGTTETDERLAKRSVDETRSM